MTDTLIERPTSDTPLTPESLADDALQPSEGDLAGRFVLASGSWALEADRGSILRPVFGGDPLGTAREIMQSVRDAENETGRSYVVCGLIPFDLEEPAQLRLTHRAVLRPRVRRAPAIATHDTAPLRAPDDPAYRHAVRRALGVIDGGHVDKVVLSRIAEFAPPAGTPTGALAAAVCERLATANRNADVFSCPDDEGALWVGASPEIVADVRAGRFLTHPLAGSLPRSIPRDDAERRLRSSDKDLREHAYVVQHIGRALQGLTDDLSVPELPELFATDSMWHLGTRIRGDLRPGISALEAALAIHPTPAVCGSPTPEAADLIREVEGVGRRFYSGLVGWTDGSGDGRWSLVLRGARLTAGSVLLQAGAGIVAGSDPEAEHAETGAKFGTMLRSLDGLVRPHG